MVQPTPKKLSRSQKEELVEKMAEQIEEKPVVGILDMQSLPAKQLQEIKKEMKEFASVQMQRKTLMKLAIEQADRDGIDQLEDNDAIQPAFIFSEKDPFQLYSLIQNNKSSAAADGGETAPNDIEVPEGDTGIGPGPMLGKLQGAGLQVQVDDGSIHVQKPGVIVETGETITEDDAEILNQIGIEPLEIGLDLDIAFSEGEIFTAEELDIDTEQYRADVEAAASQAFNLAVNAGVVNETTIETIVSEAAKKAKNVSISEGIPTEETIEEILAYASSNAEGVDSQVDLDSVEIETEDEGTEEEGSEEDNKEESSEEDKSEE
ncbi:MAG: 50S ribosomal protein L10 [Nanohaloarchaea archaeon]|nr:50S ribosomal protein L10 [Candidatus Nanohaloarchaea archaeon]